ncbi:rhamnulokinase [Actinophytocola sp.]|uniref:rhamnulokinase n=1 Tax=Actinophytocola sp. TaxID=1872138 RepID=UPI003D6C5F2B
MAAADLGAASGRVIAGRVGPGELSIEECHRFANRPVRVGGTLHWDILDLYRGVLDGVRRAGELDGVGIDAWGVDYGLLDADGALLGNPVHYRDGRTADASADRFGPDLYAVTGIQFLPFNTIHQLAAERRLERAHRLLMIPDLLAYWLTGSVGAELTIASTTQLLDVRARTWAPSLAARVGLAPDLLPPLRDPGTVLGTAADLDGTPVIAVGSHDTASAVVGVPAEGERFAYISCGTWSLVGVELTEPVLTEESRRANFTNELGVDGTVRYLRNVMGLWLLEECLRAWPDADRGTLLAEAAGLPARSVIDPDDPVFLPPGDMPARVADACRRTGQPVPATRAETVRCIVDSLAQAHRRAVSAAVQLSGHDVDVIHVVGGGARNTLLCQLTADACGLPVIAGPVEATALGNVLVQARTLGALDGDLAALRALVRATQPTTRYEPADQRRHPVGLAEM